MDKIKVNADEVVRAKAYINSVNNIGILNIECINDAGELIPLPTGQQYYTAEEWKFTGLNCSDFVNEVLYWDGVSD